MNISPDQLLTEIGRLHVANQVLTEQLAASRKQLMESVARQVEVHPPEPADADKPIN